MHFPCLHCGLCTRCNTPIIFCQKLFYVLITKNSTYPFVDNIEWISTILCWNICIVCVLSRYCHFSQAFLEEMDYWLTVEFGTRVSSNLGLVIWAHMHPSVGSHIRIRAHYLSLQMPSALFTEPLIPDSHPLAQQRVRVPVWTSTLRSEYIYLTCLK